MTLPHKFQPPGFNYFIPHAFKTPALKSGIKANLRDSAQKPRAFLRLAQDGERSRTIARGSFIL